MSKNADEIKKINELLEESVGLNEKRAAYYKRIAEGIKEGVNAEEDFKRLQKDINEEVRKANRSFNDMAEQLKNITGELTKQYSNQNQMVKGLKGMTAQANKLANEESNISSFNKKQLLSMQEKIKAEKERASEAAKGLIATKFISQGAGGLAWSTTKGIKAFIADSRYTSTLETLAFANSDGYIYIMETGSNFNGASIEAIYESPFMPISDPQVRKTFYKMTLYAEPTANMAIDLNIKYDFASSTDTKVVQPSTQQISSTGSEVFFFGASSSVFNSAKFGGELDKVYNTNIIGSGKTVAIRLEDFSTNPTFTLDTALLEYSQEDRQ